MLPLAPPPVKPVPAVIPVKSAPEVELPKLLDLFTSPVACPGCFLLKFCSTNVCS